MPKPYSMDLRERVGLTVRALDGRLAGESYRVIAARLFGDARVPKTHDLRDRTIRLVPAAISTCCGLRRARRGWRELHPPVFTIPLREGALVGLPPHFLRIARPRLSLAYRAEPSRSTAPTARGRHTTRLAAAPSAALQWPTRRYRSFRAWRLPRWPGQCDQVETGDVRDDGITRVIPGRANRKKRIRQTRKPNGRNVIERCYCRLKDFRRIATRYDKLARNFFSSVCLVSAVVYWM
jgi:hypothetical protein